MLFMNIGECGGFDKYYVDFIEKYILHDKNKFN